MIDNDLREFFEWWEQDYDNDELTPETIKALKDSYAFHAFKAGMSLEQMKNIFNYEKWIPIAMNRIANCL